MGLTFINRIGIFLFVSICYGTSTWAIYVVEDDDVDLHIAAIFPMKGTGGWLGGQGCLPAALMALKDVNRDRSLLPGYRLKMHWNDSECNPGLGASVMYDLLYKPPQKLMLLGGCSIVCSTVAEAAKMWNLVVISYGSSSPALSNRKRFPTFFRTHPSATIHNPTRIKLFQKFGWSRIAIIQEAEEVFISTSEDLEHRCKEAKIEIVTRQSFLTDVTDAVKNLVRQDARIIVGMFYGGAARRVLCEAYRQKVYGKQFVWFLIGWYEDDWYTMKDPNINCTVEQMKEAVEGHFTTEALMLNQDSKQTISGMTSQEFIHRYQKELNKMGYVDRRPEGYQEAPLAYDAIWAITLALNKTITQLRNDGISLEDFTYTNSHIANEIYSAMNSTQFLGVSGHVAFSSKGDRMAWTQIEQMIDGEYRQLGFYDTQTDNLTWIRSEHWPDGRPPQDRTIIVEVLRTVSLGLFISMCSVAFIGITWAVGLLVFNWLFRHSRYIQLSHPMCNNILLTGIILCLLCVCFLGLDGQFVEEASFSHMCQARAWLLTLGFTLSYGAMFSKIWRVHRLTTKTNNENKKVESWKLYVLVGALLFLDITILTTWQVVDPLQRKLEIFPQEDPEAGTERDIKIQPLLEHCESEYNAIWLGVLYSYKGLLLIFGIFLAYETRSVKIKQLNDSRLVGMSIYNVVVLCLITAPVTLVISSQQDATFAFVALAIIFCSFLSMALVFIPKIIELVRRPKERADARSLTDTISSKEEEERHQRLLLENEDFKRQIAQKEEEIQILTIKLREKQNLRSAHVLTTTQLGSGGGERVRICFEPQIIDGLLLAPGHKKDSISIDPVSDSGFVTGTSFARSSRASHSDFEFSESYL